MICALGFSEGKGRLETWKASFLNLVTFHASIYASKKGFCIRSEDYLVLDKLSDFFVFWIFFFRFPSAVDEV